jgi:hypothetical protein
VSSMKSWRILRARMLSLPVRRLTAATSRRRPFVGLLAGGEPDPAQVELAGGVGAVAVSGHEQVGLDLDGVRSRSRRQGSGVRALPVAIVAGRPS